MTVKILSGILIILCTSLIGVKFNENKKARKTIYNDLAEFCFSLKNTINFSYPDMKEILSGLPNSIKQIIDFNDANYILGDNIKIVSNRLTNEEKSEIALFFNQLGSYDREGFVSYIDYYYNRFLAKANSLAEMYSKYSSFYLKIGVLVGVLIFVIII